MSTSVQQFSAGAVSSQKSPKASPSSLPFLHKPTDSEVSTMHAPFHTGWKLGTLILEFVETGFVHRCKWARGVHRISEHHLGMMNREFERRKLGIEVRMDRNFIWLAKEGDSQTTVN